MNKISLPLVLVSLVLLFQIIGIVLLRRSSLTFEKYLAIMYSYLSLSILIVLFFFALWNKFSITFSPLQTIIIFFVSLFLLLGMFLNYYNRPILTHILWALFIWCIAVIMYPMIKYTDKTILIRTLCIVVGMLIVLSGVALYNTSYSFLRWESVLFYGLLSLIIVQLLDLVFSSGMTSTRLKLYSVIAIIIFIGFILYDTQVLKVKYEACRVLANKNTFSQCVNYPVSSLGIFLDTVNLFSSLVNLQR
jgi:Uncharacterised protein family UPF0005.